MRVLIYKRTHTGDPDEWGRFGVNGCMRRVRTWDFDAVIGVGGMGDEPVGEGIARRITWVGIGRIQVGNDDDKFPIWAFERFYLQDEEGPLLRHKARKLAKRMFAKHAPRQVLVDADAETTAVLKLARRSPPSPVLVGQVPQRKGRKRGNVC